MDKAEIQKEITRLEKKLEKLKEEKRNAKNKHQEMNECIGKMQNMSRKIESGLDGLMSASRNRGASLDPASKFKERYQAGLKKILKGAEANGAVEAFRRGASKARQGTSEKESDIQKINNQINTTQRRIEELKQELNKGDK